MEIKPEYFVEIVEVAVAVEGDGLAVLIVCQALYDGGWRCGKCRRGRLLRGDEKCRVCHAKIRFYERVNWYKYRQAQRRIAKMESVEFVNSKGEHVPPPQA